MSAAAAADAADAKPAKGKKKLIIIIAAVVALLGVGGGGAALYLKKKADAAAAAAEEEEEGEDGEVASAKKAKASHKKDEKAAPPVFVPLDPFVVNLADREADRFAQVGMTLEVADAKVGDELKAYMPAIRNNILLLLAHKTSAELMEAEGKELLAKEVRREALRPMGYELPEDDEDEDGGSKKKKKKKAKPVEDDLPIKSVQFSSFIIQ